MPPIASPAYAAVLFADRRAGTGLLERLSGTQRLSGAGFDVAVGRRSGVLIAAAVPTRDAEAADFQRMVAAMRNAYRPELVIGAGFAAPARADAAPDTKIIASRVVGPGGVAFRLSDGGGAIPSMQHGEVLHRDRHDATTPHEDPSGAIACNAWCLPFAAACAELSQPAAAVMVIDRPVRESLSAEASGVLRQKTAAGRAGALLRAAWRRPASLVELARAKSRGWEHQETLADAVEALIGSLQ